MRRFLFLSAGLILAVSTLQSAQGCDGAEGMPRSSQGVVSGTGSSATPIMGTAVSQGLQGTMAIARYQMAFAANQERERQKRVDQHNVVYQQRRAAEVAARPQPSRLALSQNTQ